MGWFVGKKRVALAVGAGVFLFVGSHAAAMEEEYRTPMLSGPVQTWVYQGDAYDNSRNRVFADDQEDGDLTNKIQKTGEVDTSKVGSYAVSYEVTDSDGKVSKMNTTVNVLDRNTASEEEKTIRRTMYTLPDASHLTDIGFHRGYYHDRQNLGIWLPAGETLKIRLVNGEELKKGLKLQLLNNDAETEKVSIVKKAQEESSPAGSVTIPQNGEWITVKNSFVQNGKAGSADSVPFLETPKNTTVQPVIEIAWNDSLREIPYYRTGDSQEQFFSDWDRSKAPFAIIEGDAATFLVPVIDRDRILNHSGVKKEYQFQTIDEMLGWYASFVKQYDAYAGLDFYAKEPYNQNVRAKFFIKVNNHGVGLAYYTTDHSAYNGVHSGGSLAGYLTRDWVSLHEFGHGYEGSIATQENPFVETTNNIMGYYFEQTYRPEEDFGWLLYDFNYPTRAERYAALGKRAEDRKKETISFAGIVAGGSYYNVSLFMFTNVLDKLGPQKTVAAMHTWYRKYFYENRKNASSSNVITESFSSAGGYNVVPYFEGWHIAPSMQVKDRIYDMDLPMVYELKKLIPDQAECEAVRRSLNLDGIYSLVTTDDLEETGYTSQVNLQLAIDDLSQIQGKKIRIKNGKRIVKEIMVTDWTIQMELPVGIYEIELPSPKEFVYEYKKEYLAAVKGSVNKEVEYSKKRNPLADDLQIKMKGLGNKEVAAVSVDTQKNILIWDLYGGVPHDYIDETYITISVLDASGNEIFRKELVGNQEASSQRQEIPFEPGARLILSHREARDRMQAVGRYTGERIPDYQLEQGKTEVTYVMTEKGLMQSDWDEAKQMDVFHHSLNIYSEKLLGSMTQSDVANPEKYTNEKTCLNLSLALLDEESREEYRKSYGILLGIEQESHVGYSKIDSAKLSGSADSEKTGNETAASAVDGNEDTMWHSNYSGNHEPDLAGGKNNSYTILLDENMDIGRLEYVPRKSGNNGIILSYQLSYSTTETGDDFEEISLKNPVWENNNQKKSVQFQAPNARRIKITALSTAGNVKDKYISAAEFYLYETYEIFAKNTYASDLYFAENTAQKDKNSQGQAIKLLTNGRMASFQKGIGLKAGTTVSFDLTGKHLDTFLAWAGADEKQAVVEVFADGKALYRSDFLTAGGQAEWICLDIRDVSKLEIKSSGAVSLGDAKFENGQDQTEMTLKTGEKMAVFANTALVPQDRGKVSWYSQNPSVAEVNQDGVVTAKGIGTTEVYAEYGSKSHMCVVQVVQIPETGKQDKNPIIEVKLGKISGVKMFGQKKTSLTVSWNGIPGADGYEIWRAKKGSIQFTKAAAVASLSWKDTKLSYGTSYTYKVRAYKGNQYGDFSDAVWTTTPPKKAALKKVTASGKKAVVTIKKTANAEGYEVWMKTGKASFKKAKSVGAKKLKVTVKKLKKGKKYTFKVRAYRKGSSKEKIYGEFSKTKTVKVK